MFKWLHNYLNETIFSRYDFIAIILIMFGVVIKSIIPAFIAVAILSVSYININNDKEKE